MKSWWSRHWEEAPLLAKLTAEKKRTSAAPFVFPCVSKERFAASYLHFSPIFNSSLNLIFFKFTRPKLREIMETNHHQNDVNQVISTVQVIFINKHEQFRLTTK